MKVLILKDNKPGHYNQTEGILLYLKEIDADLEVEYINIEIKSKLTRKILRFLLNKFSTFFRENSLKFLSFFYKEYSIPIKNPDLIISTGGNTSSLNAWFAKVYCCKNILNGALRGLKEELFTYITTVIDLGYKNQIILDVAPNTITKEKLSEKSDEFSKFHNLDFNQVYYTLLIGGDGAGYRYDNKFYDNLINFVKEVSRSKNIKWLITTSRRTPIEIEKKLAEHLKDYCSYFVAYNKKEEKVLLPFLGLSKAIFVTEESSSMISEAVSTKKLVYCIGIKESKPDKNYKSILNKFENKNFIKRIYLETFNLSLIKETNNTFFENNINKDFKNILINNFKIRLNN